MDRAQLAHLARLSKLSLGAHDEDGLARELTRVLDLVDALKAAPVADLTPMAHPHDAVLTWREDVVTEGDQSDALLHLAPESNGGYFLVPKVIE